MIGFLKRAWNGVKQFVRTVWTRVIRPVVVAVGRWLGFTDVEAKVERFEDPRSEAFDRYVPKLHKTSSAIINEWCHGVFFVTKKIITKKEDKGFNRTRVRGLDTGDSVMYCTGQPSHVAGNRLGLPAELPLDFAAYAEAAFGSPAEEPVPEDVPPVVKKKTTKKQKETING